MSDRVSVVIPVKDGARHLSELAGALRREAPAEVIVIDSGSADGSAECARAAGFEVVEIPPAEFGHGRTRNLGAERARGEFIAFLTQDATPEPGWLAALEAAFALDERVGAVFGPHVPRPSTSPMIARELSEFFAGFAADGDEPRLFGPGDPSFLSNVNAAYRRACWEELRFDDVPYSEDQAFGRALAAHPRWRKAYAPRAAVLHAHDYPPLEFMRRYFDEYRGLRETIGHVERLGARSASRDVRGLVAADRRWMCGRGYDPRSTARWTARSLVHHSGRKVFSALGSHAHALPAPVQRALSLERRAGGRPPGAEQPPAVGAAPVPSLPAAVHQPARQAAHDYEPIARVLRAGPAQLVPPVDRMSDRTPLHVAFVVPPFSIGSGGHNIIFQLVLRLERMGHTCSIWVTESQDSRGRQGPAALRKLITEHFAPVRAPVFSGFSSWYGADVAVATGWQTVFPLLEQESCRARAYLINDHEPEFHPTSIESLWAEETYRQGLYGIAGSPWLRDLYVTRYGGHAGSFRYGVDHAVYRPQAVRRRRDTVVFYCRRVTPRRAVALGLLALHALHRRRPDLRIVMFGDTDPFPTPFPYEHLGVATPEQLSWVYSEATVGLCLSLTNYSLIPQEMLACGLPCVDVAAPSSLAVFGPDGPVRLAPVDVDAIAAAIEELVDDGELWERASRRGLDYVAGASWDAAAEQVEVELRNALRSRA